MRYAPTLPCLAAALLLGGLSLNAHAGRPLATEDAGVLERGECELESFIGRQRATGQPSTRSSSLQLGCGVSGGSQLALAVARERSDDEGVTSLTLLGKTLLHEVDEGPSFTLAWSASADRIALIGWRHAETSLTGVMTLALAKDLNFHANLGWSRNQQTRQDTTRWGLALEQSTEHGFDLMGELFDDDRSHHPWVQAGLRWTAIPGKLFFDTSYGFQTGRDGARAFTVGLRYAF